MISSLTNTLYNPHHPHQITQSSTHPTSHFLSNLSINNTLLPTLPPHPPPSDLSHPHHSQTQSLSNSIPSSTKFPFSTPDKFSPLTHPLPRCPQSFPPFFLPALFSPPPLLLQQSQITSDTSLYILPFDPPPL
eukprot:TRINITY_DN55_c0_g1_i12.p3 TRINITY_DN55_c0_g1~~TRINITY_DN55_c0_g1_i12.p3  ORF type:complete len:133 (+),score=13.07 TRINITY_DN55_c0_g1_i12:2563-2961(+)